MFSSIDNQLKEHLAEIVKVRKTIDKGMTYDFNSKVTKDQTIVTADRFTY